MVRQPQFGMFFASAAALLTSLSLQACSPSSSPPAVLHAELTTPVHEAHESPESPYLEEPDSAQQDERDEAAWRAWYEQFREPPYALDGASRDAVRDKRGKLECPDLDFETYRGTSLKYTKAVKINPHFKPQLERFEQIANEVAIEVYGRPPSKIWHYGTYNCRTIRKRKHRLSEHAFGNAIDVAGFRFDALPKSEREGLNHKRAGRSFKVSVLDHWDSEKGFERLHALFLKTLVIKLAHDDTFRGMIVPPAPGHKNHLHLDMGRWSYIRGDVTMPPEPDASTS